MHAYWTACFKADYHVPPLAFCVLILEAGDQSLSPRFVVSPPDDFLYLHIGAL